MESPSNFFCRIANVKSLVDILSCLVSSQKKDQVCSIEINRDALIFIVTGIAKSTQARITLERDIFDDFTVTSDIIHLCVNLSMLLDCLQIFGFSLENCVSTMSYTDVDAIFSIALHDNGISTSCDLATLFSESTIDEEDDYGLFASFINSNEVAQVILKSDQLREVFQEIVDNYGTRDVTIEIAEHPAKLMISAHGSGDHYTVEFPRNPDVFVSFQCQGLVRQSYPITSLQLGLKALNIAKETFIRVNQTGVMCIQHLISSSTSSRSNSHGSRDQNRCIETFMDFLMLPNAVPEE